MTVSRIVFFFSLSFSVFACSAHHEETDHTESDINGTEPCHELPVCKDGDQVASSFDTCIDDKTCYPVERCGYRLWCHPHR